MVPSPAVAGLPVGAAGFAAGSAWPSRSKVQRPSRQVVECAHCSRRFQHTKEPNHAAKLLHSVCFGAPAWTSQLINLLGKHPENNRVHGLGFCLGLRLRFRLRFRLRRNLSLQLVA